ncbi:MAG: 7-carboxy-7-deazaguanine synthase QueE [Candidatus Omnitrophica bacterium]|nr:7-carboxy-7-deazaguanine synthase QueE [Candidatus Omnitrophota bacterium]
MMILRQRPATSDQRLTGSAEIHEIFFSFQGEGILVGEPMVFVRFAYCDLACRFCDTPPPKTPTLMAIAEIAGEVSRLNAAEGPFRFVSLTGGEPLRYAAALRGLLPRLIDSGFKTYLESDGTKARELEEVIQWVHLIAMDIKLPSSTGMRPFWTEHESFLNVARRTEYFIKVVVTGSTPAREVNEAARLAARFNPNTPFIIQPASPFGDFRDAPGADALPAFVRAARAHLEDVRVIGQNHKLIGVR